MVTMIMNTIQMLTTLFLIFAVGMFLYEAWEKRKDISDLLGNAVSAFFMACAIFLIWR